jgi:hypothetical protein
MAIAAPRDLKIGKIIDKTLGVVERTAVPALIFVIVVTALCAPITWFTVGSLSPSRLVGGELLKAVIGIVAAYFLIVPMLRRAGLHTRSDADAFLPFVGLSVLSTLGVLLGFIAFIIPGLFVMARWSIAQPLLVGRGAGVMEALGESWERTRGSEFSIIIAALALALAPIVVMIATAVFFEETSPVRIGVTQLASSAMSAIFLGMGVAIYGLMMGGSEARTFE